MAAKDGSFQFDFSGTYNEVIPNKRIAYTLDDDRKVFIDFEAEQGATKMFINFETEQLHPEEFQKAGWQAILDNFKHYIENK